MIKIISCKLRKKARIRTQKSRKLMVELIGDIFGSSVNHHKISFQIPEIKI